MKKITDKQRAKIVERKKYYAESIEAFRKKHGRIFCEECGAILENPTGRNVSHILAGSNAPHLYLHPLNHKILCAFCEQVWTGGNRKKMNIWPECEEIMQRLRSEA